MKQAHSLLLLYMHNILQFCVRHHMLKKLFMKKDYSVLLIQRDGNLASDVLTRCSGRPQEMKTSYKTHLFIGCT